MERQSEERGGVESESETRGGNEAFPNLGLHCHHHDCGLLDFLPFVCHACGHTFCLDHRTYTTHGCPNASQGDKRVAVCTDCRVSVRVPPGATEAAALAEHRRGDCERQVPLARRRVRCPVRGCTRVLTTSNRVTCKDCHTDVCLTHRFASDHKCSSLSAAAAKSGGGAAAHASPADAGRGMGHHLLLAAALARRSSSACGNDSAQGTQSNAQQHKRSESSVHSSKAGGGGQRDVLAH